MTDLEKLRDIAKRAGYSTDYDPFGGTNINYTRKVITVGVRIADEETAEYAHEIGHMYGYRIIGRYCRIIAECGAWLIGYIVCFVNGIKIKGFWKTAGRCLKTYINKL